jgi:hypothetical protein
VRAAAPPGCDELTQQLEGAVTEVTGVLDELREIARGLHPALRALARRCTIRSAWTCGWRSGCPSRPSSPLTSRIVIRPGQITNAA